jgi:hypothetical protein
MENRLLRRVILLASLLLFTLAAGTLGFRIVEGYPWFDAFYVTLITVTTVGCQEVHPLSQAGRLFNSALICGGRAQTSSSRPTAWRDRNWRNRWCGRTSFSSSISPRNRWGST